MDKTQVSGQSYTSNHVKLLKHMDKLSRIQQGLPPSPVMAHISLINACNLTCSFCCFANRDMSDRLPKEKVFQALDSFKKIGVRGIEYTGGGEPTLHPDFKEIVRYTASLGFKIGVCTNGKSIAKHKDIIHLFSWVRLGLYGFYEGYDYDLTVFDGTDVSVSAAYVWDEAIHTSSNPNVTGEWTDATKKKLAVNFQKREAFEAMIAWVEKNKIPTRIAFNAIKPLDAVKADIETIRGVLAGMELKYAFLSDFNFKGERRNDHCYMHMVKPFLFTDGYIYACPSAELSLENNYNYIPTSQFMVCDIDGIEDFYSKPPSVRKHACKFCKYAMQNELIDDIVKPTLHNDFA